MKTPPVGFAALCQKAEALLTAEPSAEQVIVVLTAKSNLYHFANHDVIAGSHADEETFIKLLSEHEDTEITRLVCMWKDLCIDVPSWHFRKLLTELDPANSEAQVLLDGGSEFHTKAIKIMVPPGN